MSPGSAPGAHRLDPLHPTLREKALALYERAAAEGIAFRFIHGFAPYKPRNRIGPGGWANWHNFGLAFDMNLAHRKGLGDAKAHFSEDAAIWARIGQIASEVGLVWGGSWRSSYDPFHFEWHPGHDSVINRDDLQSFLKVAGKNAQRWQAVWKLFPGGNALPPTESVTTEDEPDMVPGNPKKTEKPLKPRKKPRPKRR